MGYMLGRILFKDNNGLNLRTTESVLEEDGYSVACIADERDDTAGLAFDPDLVVFNPGFNGPDGLEIIDKMSSLSSKAPLVLARQSDPARCQNAIAKARSANLPVLGSIDRPYRPEILERLCKTIAEKHRPYAQADVAHVTQLIADNRLIPNIVVDFQAKHSLQSGAVVGYEALTRLATRRAMNPQAIFTPGLDISLEVEATAVVVDTCARLAVLLEQGHQNRQVSFNCSATLVAHGGFFDMMCATIAKHGVAPHSLMVEVTEDVGMADISKLTEACSLLYAHGVDVSIDDFGAQSSNLDRVSRIPFQEIKIDKEVFWACCEGRLSVSIIREVLDFCRATSRKSVIEGIETSAHLAQAKLLHADFGQGFYWGRAVSPQIFAPNWP